MNQSKDLNAVYGQLRSLLARDDVGSEQKKYIEAALNDIKRLRRKSHITQADVYSCVRRVAENLLNAFYKD